MKDITVIIHTSGNKIEEERTLKTVSGWVKRVVFVKARCDYGDSKDTITAIKSRRKNKGRRSEDIGQKVESGWVLELNAGEEVSIPLKIELRQLSENTDFSGYEIPIIANYTDVWSLACKGRESFYKARGRHSGAIGRLNNPVRGYIKHEASGNITANSEIKNILVVKMRGIGDTVLATPAFKNLKRTFPEANIFALVKKAGLSALTCNPNLSGVIIYNGFFKTLLRVRVGNFDIAIAAQAGFRSALLAKLSGAKLLSVNNHNGKNYFSSVLVDKPEEYENAIERDLDGLRALGIPSPEHKPEVFVYPSEIGKAVNIFKKLGFRKHEKVIGLNPSASKENKMWGRERYAQLADRLKGLSGIRVLFFTDPSNKKLVFEITGLMKTKVAILGVKSLREVAGVISKLDLYIGNDSGLSHIAAGLNTPTITIIGPDEAKIFHPYTEADKHYVVSKDVECKPCWKEGCKYNNDCLRKVTVDDVYEVVKKWKRSAQ